MNEQYMLFDGSKLVKLSETSWEQIDLLGRHMRYLHAEHVVLPSELSRPRAVSI